jgi:hypothetical protein
MKSESPILLTVLIIVVCSGIGTAQECQIGCQSKIDALKDEVAVLERAFAQQVPYLEKFNLTPKQQDPSHSPSAEQVLPNYLNVLLVHVTLDHKQTAVLLPSAHPTSNPPSYTPNQAIFSSSCRDSGNSSASAKVDVFLGLLRQDASGKDVFGVRVTVEGCNATSGQIPIQISVLTKL